jgi:phage gpG-like protein
MNLNYRITGDKELSFYLGNIAKNIKPQALAGLNEIGTHLQKKVKAKFGKYQEGWPKLKRASVIAKYRKRGLSGISTKGRKKSSSATGGDDPLVLFGQLKNSIEKELNTGSMEVEVYSDNIYSAVHEYGYKNVPARSYMRLTLAQEEDEVVKIMGNRIEKIL